jgi:hypothetical protein
LGWKESNDMRALIVLVAALILLALVGWITFSHHPGQSSINLETNKIKHDTREAMESGARILDNAKQNIERADQPAPGGPSPRAPDDSRATEGSASPG